MTFYKMLKISKKYIKRLLNRRLLKRRYTFDCGGDLYLTLSVSKTHENLVIIDFELIVNRK